MRHSSADSARIQPTKPAKPTASYPLYAHNSRRWAKKICGQTIFFGPWDDPEGALAKYLDERIEWENGRNPRRRRLTGAPTLAELVNVYLADCEARVKAGSMTERTFNGYQEILKRLATFRSKHEQPSQWEPLDFSDLKEQFAKPIKRTNPARGGAMGVSVKRRASTSIDVDIRAVKAFLNWCFHSNLIEQPKFGKSFSTTPAKQKRLKKAKVGPRDLTADEIRAYIEHASLQYKPVLLLAINTAMGSTDIAALKVSDYSGGEWLTKAREKTGIGRKWWLWDETREALDAYLATRPRRQQDHNLLLTKYRGLWVDGRQDSASKAFGKLRQKLKSRGQFYDLRRTFATVADQTLDFVVTQYCMGHSPTNSDMSAIYRQRLDDDRIKRVCLHVHDWLFQGGAA